MTMLAMSGTNASSPNYAAWVTFIIIAIALLAIVIIAL
jgi:hypothetical protein